MSLFGKKEKQEIQRLKEQMSPGQIEVADIQGQIVAANEKLQSVLRQVADAEQKLSAVKKNIIETDEAALLQSFGFFAPHYLYELSDDYKEALAVNRADQKKMIRDKQAITGALDWTVNGSKSQGKKMVSDFQKLLLRAFNSECDDTIEHVKFNNYDASQKRIELSYNAISDLGTSMRIQISGKYLNLKLKELRLMHEYRQKKQDEKDALKLARERLREEAKLQKELEQARKNLEKEQTHYTNALQKINAQLETATAENRVIIEEKKAEILRTMEKISAEFENLDYRAANQRAGYVYVISNIGAFGENVYKIGMTRRLEPMDRIDELGDASVPFDFDVHALIFSDDAPALEAALHKAFESRKLNMVNTRREFFNASLEEIKTVIKENFDKSVEFVDIAPAEQYRESLLMRKTQ